MGSDKFIISILWKLNVSTTSFTVRIFQLGFYIFTILPELSHVPLFWVAELILFHFMFCNMMREESNSHLNITNSTPRLISMCISRGKYYFIGTIWQKCNFHEKIPVRKKYFFKTFWAIQKCMQTTELVILSIFHISHNAVAWLGKQI